MTDRCELHGDVEAYALGALDDTERIAFERHLDTCPWCLRETASYVPVLNAMREISLPPAPPLRGLATRRGRFRPAIYPIAAALLLAVGGFGGATAGRVVNGDMMMVAEMGATSVEEIRLQGDGVEGRAIVGRARRRTAFVVAGLPQPDANTDYQVWVSGGGTSSPGVLRRSMEGYEVLVVPGDILRGARTITITLEPAGGSKTMSGKPLMSSTTPPA